MTRGLKRIISTALTLAISFTLLPKVSAYNMVIELSDINATFIETDTSIEITGIASEFIPPNESWAVEIPLTIKGKPVTALSNRSGDTTCSWNGGFSSVLFPSGSQVAEIKRLTFSGCTALENIEIPATAINLGEAILYGCENLKSVTFNEGWSNPTFNMASLFGLHTEYLKLPIDCTKLVYENTTSLSSGGLRPTPTTKKTLASVFDYGEGSEIVSAQTGIWENTQTANPVIGDIKNFPDGVTTIDWTAASIVTNIISGNIEFGENSKLSEIKGSAKGSASSLWGNSQKKLVLPKSLKTIGMNALSFTKYLEIVLPDGLQELKTQAIFYNPYLIKINIPNSVTVTGTSAIGNNTSLKFVDYGPNIVYESMFAGCVNLSDFDFSNITEIQKNAFSNCNFPAVEIPDSLQYLGENAFSYNSNLTSLKINPYSSKLVGTFQLNTMKATNVTSINVPVGINQTNPHFGKDGVSYYVYGNTDINDNSSYNGRNCKYYYMGNAKPRFSSNDNVKVYGGVYGTHNQIYLSDRTAWEKLREINPLYKDEYFILRDTAIDLSTETKANSVVFTANLVTYGGTPEDIITLYQQNDDGQLVALASQKASISKTLTAEIPLGDLLLGNRKYVVKYDVSDPYGRNSCSAYTFYDKGVANTFITETHSTSASGELTINPTVTTATGETPRGIVKIYQGENATGKLLFKGAWDDSGFSLSKKQIPYGTTNYYLEFTPSDAGQKSCHTSFTYTKASTPTTIDFDIVEGNTSISINARVTPEEALGSGEVYLYLGDEVTGTLINPDGALTTKIYPNDLSLGNNMITAVYRSDSGDYENSSLMKIYTYSGKSPTVSLKIENVNGYANFTGKLEGYKEPLDGTIRVYRGYDNTGTLLFSGAAPSIFKKFNLATELNTYGEQNYYIEFISKNLNNQNCNNLAVFSKESKASSLIADVTTISKTEVRISAQVFDKIGLPIRKGIISIFRGANTSGVLVSSQNLADEDNCTTILNPEDLAIGGNEFYIVYRDDTLEYCPSNFSVLYTKLNSGESGSNLDGIYQSYEEQMKALQLTVAANQKAYMLKLDELIASLNSDIDTSDFDVKLAQVLDALKGLNLKVSDLSNITSQFKELKDLILNNKQEVNFDALKDFINKTIENNNKEINSLISKLESNKELTDKDISRIKEILGDNIDYSKEFKTIKDQMKSLSEALANIKTEGKSADEISNQVISSVVSYLKKHANDNSRNSISEDEIIKQVADYCEKYFKDTGTQLDTDNIIEGINKYSTDNSKEYEAQMIALRGDLIKRDGDVQTLKESLMELEESNERALKYLIIIIIILGATILIMVGSYIIAKRVKNKKEKELNTKTIVNKK